MEVIEISLEEASKLQRAGFMSLQHYEEYKSCASLGLVMYGDEFQQAIGLALHRSNVDNALKIIRYWNQDCEQHHLLYKMYLAKEKAANQG